MELSLKPRHVNEVRRVLDEFLADHGVPDELLVRSQRERGEFTREDLTLALSGRGEMILHFAQEHITTLQIMRTQRGSLIEFVKINGKASHPLSRELNAIFLCIINNDLPPIEKVMRTLSEKRLGTSFFQALPTFQVPSPEFHAECYGGGADREITQFFERLSERGQVKHKRFKVACQWGNALRVDAIEIHLASRIIFFLAANGIIVWHTDQEGKRFLMTSQS
jgi:hypothetical protein